MMKDAHWLPLCMICATGFEGEDECMRSWWLMQDHMVLCIAGPVHFEAYSGCLVAVRQA